MLIVVNGRKAASIKGFILVSSFHLIIFTGFIQGFILAVQAHWNYANIYKEFIPLESACTASKLKIQENILLNAVSYHTLSELSTLLYCIKVCYTVKKVLLSLVRILRLLLRNCFHGKNVIISKKGF